MKQAFIILLSLLVPLARADRGGFARAAEFGFPKLGLSQDLNALKAQERVWHIEGEKPFRALLLGFEGEWGEDATLILRTPTGRELKVPARLAGDADLQSVRDWITDNGFVPIKPIGKPPVLAKIISVIRPEDRRISGYTDDWFASDVVFMTLTNGTNTEWRVNRKHIHEDYAQKVSYNTQVWVDDETLAVLERNRRTQQEDTGTPLPIAENTDEAIAWSAATGNSIVMLLLNRRGSLHDTAFRQYLAKYPYATGLWAKRHVFLIAYANDEGAYPAECIQAAARLRSQHPFFARKELLAINDLGFSNKAPFSQSINIDILVFCHPCCFPESGASPQATNKLSIKINDFLALPPELITFGLF